MALKTMLRQLISKWGIMSIDLQKALDKDMAVIQEDGSADYVENNTTDVETNDVVADQDLQEVHIDAEEEQGESSDIESEFFNN